VRGMTPLETLSQPPFDDPLTDHIHTEWNVFVVEFRESVELVLTLGASVQPPLPVWLVPDIVFINTVISF